MKLTQAPKKADCSPVAKINTTSKNVVALRPSDMILSPGKTSVVAEEAASIPSRSTEASSP